jgi:hypothetical protein
MADVESWGCWIPPPIDLRYVGVGEDWDVLGRGDLKAKGVKHLPIRRDVVAWADEKRAHLSGSKLRRRWIFANDCISRV